MRVGLLLMLLLEGIPPPAGMGGQARHLIQQAYQAELEVIAAVAAPDDREILAKQRSSHWAKMLFSSRIYFDGSMSNLFRMDSSTIDALIRAGSSLEATADRFAIGPSTVSGIVREVSSIKCQELSDLVSFPPLITYGHLDMNDALLPRRRFELFIYLLTGRPLPAQAAATDLTEEKPPAPQSEDKDMDDEEVEPSQIAHK
ncbi:hypothetical protein F444_06960 [Phytophthora nicotianae P1976]|nr:hypothetical protein F444_06960 [Phytophthora nicotianae P1976]